jgi:hypothetical protein
VGSGVTNAEGSFRFDVASAIVVDLLVPAHEIVQLAAYGTLRQGETTAEQAARLLRDSGPRAFAANVRPGVGSVHIRADGSAGPIADPRVRPTADRDESFLRGRATNADGEPMAGVAIGVFHRNDYVATWMTDAEGRFETRVPVRPGTGLQIAARWGQGATTHRGHCARVVAGADDVLIRLRAYPEPELPGRIPRAGGSLPSDKPTE